MDILIKLDEERTTTRSSSGVNCDTPYVFARAVIYDFMQVKPCLRVVCVARRLPAPLLLHGVQTNAQIKLIRPTRTRARRMLTPAVCLVKAVCLRPLSLDDKVVHGGAPLVTWPRLIFVWQYAHRRRIERNTRDYLSGWKSKYTRLFKTGFTCAPVIFDFSFNRLSATFDYLCKNLVESYTSSVMTWQLFKCTCYVV